jgi:dolichol kinase
MDAEIAPAFVTPRVAPISEPNLPVASPVRRPHNGARSAFHAMTGIFALGLIQVTTPTQLRVIAVGSALGCWLLEITRRRSEKINAACMWVLGRFAHPHERYEVNSSTWYASALAIMALAFPARSNSVAVIVLGFADPVAALVGRRFGRIRFQSGRSLEGSLAFAVVGALTAWAALRFCYPAESLGASVLAAACGAVAGALAELLSPTDDNFSIPVAASLAATLVALV